MVTPTSLYYCTLSKQHCADMHEVGVSHAYVYCGDLKFFAQHTDLDAYRESELAESSDEEFSPREFGGMADE